MSSGYGVRTRKGLVSDLPLTNAKGAHCAIAQQNPVTDMIKVAPDTVEVMLYIVSMDRKGKRKQIH